MKIKYKYYKNNFFPLIYFFPRKTISHQRSAKMQFPQTEIPPIPFPPIYFPRTKFPLKIVVPKNAMSG